ncbi:hypothetical protein L1611_04040 [Alkalihalobacillus sp. EGI L200015]|nr:hypothetical protein [Pseudalkalibacillus salsuginis]
MEKIEKRIEEKHTGNK